MSEEIREIPEEQLDDVAGGTGWGIDPNGNSSSLEHSGMIDPNG